MRIKAWILAASLVVLLAGDEPSRAAQDQAAEARASPIELLVFEHADCLYCRVFHRDVVPIYRETPQAARVPLRFIDVDRAPTAGLRLNARIHTVPTFVLMKDGREVDRIVGYWAPDYFFKMLAYMLIRAE